MILGRRVHTWIERIRSLRRGRPASHRRPSHDHPVGRQRAFVTARPAAHDGDRDGRIERKIGGIEMRLFMQRIMVNRIACETPAQRPYNMDESIIYINMRNFERDRRDENCECISICHRHRYLKLSFINFPDKHFSCYSIL